MGNAIFDDLDIEYKDMLSNPEAFMSRCYEAAEKLKDILRADISLKAMETKYQKSSIEAPVDWVEALNSLYDAADKMPMNQLLDAIKQTKKLAQDLENLFTDRCIFEAANENNAVADKKTAHEQYTALKDSVNSYISALKVLKAFDNYDFKPLPSMPGNYGSQNTNLIRYIFIYKDEQYRNHTAIARLLNMKVTNDIGVITRMDVLEFIEKNPDCGVIVKKVT